MVFSNFNRILCVASLAILAHASVLPRAIIGDCRNPVVTESNKVTAGDTTLHFASVECSSKGSRRDTATTDTTCTAVNAVNDTCSTTCTHDSGILPPISEDCDSIVTAVNIMVDQGAINPTFQVAPWHMQTLTFGTCSYYFTNLGASCGDVQYSWHALASAGAVAGGSCFPPHQPFSPEGVCKSDNGRWSVGASHS